MTLYAVHFAPSSSIYHRNSDHVGYSQHPMCGTLGDTIATDRRRKVTCKRCLKWRGQIEQAAKAESR